MGMSALAEAYEAEGSARTILAALPVAIYTTDAEGFITFYNEAAAKFWGRTPQLHAEKWCGSPRLYRADGSPMPLDECPMALALKTGRPVCDIEVTIERLDGSRSTFLPSAMPLFDPAGRLTGGVNMLMDITARKAFERTQAHLSAIVESSDDAILSKDLDGIIQSWNNGAERIFGYTADEAVGRPILMLIPEDRHGEEPGILERIRRGERIEHYETVRRRKDGTLIDVSLTVSPIRNRDGTVIGASKIARDISERKRAQEARELLLHEIKHRVKNTLGTVQAIASQTFHAAPREERDAFGARLRAMAEAHDVLTSQDWGDVAVREIMARAIAPFDPQRFITTGDGTQLPAPKALLLAMVVHELGTNAVKYGALSNSCGRVAVAWSGKPDRLLFHWRESGGPVVKPPQRKGFGSNLIQRAVAGEHGSAHFDYAPDGLKGALEIRY
jgi:PAS domain S-box-containing protein